MNTQHTIGISVETKDILDEFKYTHREEIRLTGRMGDGAIRWDDVIYYAISRVRELEKAEAIRKAKEQTTEILKEEKGEAIVPNNNIQEREGNIL